MHLRRRFGLTASAFVAAVALAACGSDGSPTDGDAPDAAPAAGPAATAPAGDTPTHAAPAPPCESPLDALTQRERIAQLFTVGVSSMADARRAVLETRVGGIFLGGDVVGEVVSGDGLGRLKQDSSLPLLVAIDEEGGRVSRVAPYAGPLPSARVMAATMSPEEVRAAARARGEFLAGMGVTVDFAPSVDVSDQPDGAVIGDRSFSPDPEQVIRYARAFSQGLLDSGVTPVFKHFPGHGRSSGDSHHESVSVPPLDHLVPHDLRPFAELADTPGAGMMVGHPRVPGLTGVDRPASLSPAAYRLLRDGTPYGAPPFDGAIFTDDLSGMRAVTDDFPLPQAVVESLVAGADSPLWISTAQLGQALDAVERAVADGYLSRERLDASLARMARLRGVPGCVGAPTSGGVPGAGALGGTDLATGRPPAPGLPRLPG